jgi:hypothetical protein
MDHRQTHPPEGSEGLLLRKGESDRGVGALLRLTRLPDAHFDPVAAVAAGRLVDAQDGAWL